MGRAGVTGRCEDWGGKKVREETGLARKDLIECILDGGSERKTLQNVICMKLSSFTDICILQQHNSLIIIIHI